MPTVDFGNVSDASEFNLLPEGQYLVSVEQVDEDVTQKGDERLNIRYSVIDGEHAGASLFDHIYFSQRALPRAKLLLKALGISADGVVSITPDLLLGKTCRVDATIEIYAKSDGSEGKSNSIPFAGYHSVAGEESGRGASESLSPY